MWNTSDKYKELIYDVNSECLLNVYIEDALIDDNDIIDFRISHNLFSSDKVELGTTPSKVIELQIKASALPQKYDNFYVETGLNIDGVDEIVPIGYFILENIEKDDEIVTITAVDYMMIFERILNTYKALPCTAINLLRYICNYCGVELGSNSFLNSDIVINKYDTSMTARQMIGYIAEQAGGFACIGRDGKLYIKPIENSSTEIDIELFEDYKWGEKFICNEVDFDNEEQQYYISDTEINGAELDNILDTPLYSNVEGQSIEINPNNLYIRSEEQVRNIYNNLKDLQIYGFEGQTIIDPAIDIGDIIYIEDKPVVYQGDMEYTRKFKSNISSKIETEQKKSTSVGASLSYSTRMRNLKGQVQETQEQVVEFEKTKVDKNNIIQTINESESESNETNTTNNQTINPNKLNINGIESVNGNFGVDEDGNMYCQDARINGTLYNKDKEVSFSDDNIHISKELQAFNVNFIEDENGVIKAYSTFGKDTLITDEETGGHKLLGIETTVTEDEVKVKITNPYSYDNGIEIKSRTNGYSEILVGQDPEDDSSEEISYNYPGTKITPYTTVTPVLEQYSIEKIKKNIEKLENVTNIVRNSEIYTYNLKSEKDTDKKHVGFIIGERFKTPNEVISKSGHSIDTYTMSSIIWKCSQELIEKDIEKEKKIKDLENVIKELQDKVQELSERS